MGKSIGYIKKENLLFNKLDKAVSIIITKNLGIRKNESLLVVYDSRQHELAKKFSEVASKSLKKVDMLKIPVAKVNGQEPPKKAVHKFLQYDVLIFLTTRSLSHTKARREATAKGIRIASMPGVTPSVLRRSIDIDYDRLKATIKKVAARLNKAKKVRIKTSLGTDIEFSITKRKAHGLSAGIYNKKGKWGNLPEGEVFIAPVEGTANGIFVVDGSLAGFGKITHPLIFFVENGYVTKITNGRKIPRIKKMLDRVGKKAGNIAEFGIGFNSRAKVTGIVLEDEKAAKTCHLALGNNIGFGGKTDVPLHIDCVIKKPTMFLDNKPIIKKGRLNIQGKYI
ncbi:aminopeptidase [Candidatus Woesearchaeota archaeon]|nr:aminopeptidase [Candidatus Woesearchaeota archaeon]